MTHPCDPYIRRFDPPLSIRSDGSLAGLTAAVKDNYHIAGQVSGNGNPEWVETHEAATETGTLVSRFLEAGVMINGKSHLDEMAYSIIGKNARYGTPVNPSAPDRVPGGSSSGSAVLTASTCVDIGIGSDTGGSVRVPAAFTGTFGLRPTHGSLPADGLIPFASSYDTPGFFTRDLPLMARVLDAARGSSTPGASLKNFRAPTDLWGVADPDTSAMLETALPDAEIDRSPFLPAETLTEWFECFRVHQAYEIWQTHGEWVVQTNPTFGPGVAERFENASRITHQQFSQAQKMRSDILAFLQDSLAEDTCILMPTVPGPAPLLSASEAELDRYRTRAISLLCIAGHGGLPQLTLPVTGPGDLPIGLSLVGARGSDADLIATAQEMLVT